MGKVKKSISAAKKASKTAQRQESVANNPFEVHVNKRKHEILGRKMKHDRGLPGVSRSKAIKKRETTLLAEYKQRNKANVFVDKRFGENDNEMSVEDKLLKRFAIEKQKHHEKSGIYNLEEEELTHMGQSLGDFDKFDDVRLSDEEEEDENAGNDVAETHFGGFLKKKKPDNHNEDSKPKSRKEIMEEVVAKAKLKKHERQAAKEQNTNMTDMLDDDWKDIRKLMSFRDPHAKQESTKADDYDITVKELAFEVKGKATNRLKSDVELAKEEQEKLKKLEEERIRRMKGIPINAKPKHMSADDLGDSFTVREDTRTMLSYDDGKINLPDGEENLKYEWLTGHNDNDKEDEDDEDDDDEGGNGEDDGGDSDDDNEDDDEEDSGEDLNTDSENDEGEGEQEEKDIKRQTENKTKSSQNAQKASKPKSSISKELPFTFRAPQTYKEFKDLISPWPESRHLTIIQRIKACNHPKINPENKAKMETFFTILIGYVAELVEQDPPALGTVDKLTKSLFEISQFSPINACTCMQNTLKSLHSEYNKLRESKGGKAVFPGLKTLIYLRLVSLLFPTSDLKHCVCTSAMVFMSQILAQSCVRSLTDVLKGLFLCNLYLECVRLSKRFVPEAINFLCGVLFLASDKSAPVPQVAPPFKANSKWSDLLTLKPEEKSRDVAIKPFVLSEALTPCDSDHRDTLPIRIGAVHLALHLTDQFALLYKDLPSFKEIFDPVLAHLQRIPIQSYPQPVKDLQSSLRQSLTTCSDQPRNHLTLHARRPEPLKAFTPKFQEHYEIKSKKAKVGNKKTNEVQKLKYKLKREFKGAVREVRKDSQFLSRQKLQEQLERDAERMRKVKEIEHMLGNEQAEVNVMNRKKRKLKR
ncbi:nucleolar protein 14-like [Actinia tenebrosa]|uniref:Nucleolar protein 14-like n=1 Tax=Actinia tenebrosa TaxID=6105 RepID=A0A6P8ITQ8_ACTTE|nr:nucleolar protein 14-like [Actinia tenebrosa]